MGSPAAEGDLAAAMEQYAQVGIGGLEITPVYAASGSEDQFIGYLTPRWMEVLTHTLRQAQRLDMGIDLATSSGSFGGPWIGDDDASRSAVYKIYRLAGGERLSEPVTHIQTPWVRAIGRRRISASELKQPLHDNENLQALGLQHVRFERALPLQVLMAYSEEGQTIDLTNRVAASGHLDWTAPDGRWTLYAVFLGWHGKMVERAGPGAEGRVADHFSGGALRQYVQRFDEAFAGRDISALRAFFKDSYEVDDGPGESDWTPKFLEEFENRRGYDLRNHLSALFGNEEGERNRRVLSDYRETISDLLVDRFAASWNSWAAGKGAVTRYQAHGAPANLLDLYSVAGIPETEGRDILRFKFASSSAHVMGKQLASAQSATWLNESFRSSLSDVKRALDVFFLGGINHIVYHGATLSPREAEWPGQMFSASVHVGPTNSIWRDFPILNGYVTRVQSFLQTGRPANDVLLYFPIYDRWAQRGRTLLWHFAGGARGTTARGAAEDMLKLGYTFDFVSDRQLGILEFFDEAIRAGDSSYKTVVVPRARYMPLGTVRKVVDLARDGATIVLHNDQPRDVPGWGNLEQRREELRRLLGRLQFSVEDDSGVRVARTGRGRILLGDDLGLLLEAAGVRRETMVDRGLHFVRRRLEDGQVYFVNNRGDRSVDGWVPFRTASRSVAIFDPMTGRFGRAMVRQAEREVYEAYLQLAPGESVILRMFDEAPEGPAFPYWKPAGDPRQLNGIWSLTFIEGGPQMPGPFELGTLRSWTTLDGEAAKVFSGTARYALSFTKPAAEDGAEAWLLDLGQVAESARVRLNGVEVAAFIDAPYRIAFSSGLLRENNSLEIEVSNSMANRMAELDRQQAEFGRLYNVAAPVLRGNSRGLRGSFNASRPRAVDSGLMGPVTLTPLEALP